VGAVHQDGAKMAKSTGNLTLVSDLLTDLPPAAVRLLLLDRPWAQPWEYHPAAVAAATARLERLYTAAGRLPSSTGATDAAAQRLLDDLDVPGALDVAEAEGGDAARLVMRTLALV